VIQGLASQGVMRGRGLLARPLWIIPKSTVGHREIKPTTMPDSVREEYERVTKLIWQKEARTDDRGARHPWIAKFSPAADDAMAEFERWLEPQLGPDGGLAHIADWACKLAGEAARIALILQIAEATAASATAAKAVPLTIEETTVRKAIQLARDYLLPHALAAFDCMGADPVINDARLLLEALKSFACSASFACRRDLFNRVRTRKKFRTVESLSAPLRILVEYGYIREKKNEVGRKPGRPSSPVYEINPLWDRQTCSQNMHNTQNSEGTDSEPSSYSQSSQNPEDAGGEEEF
jgi:hypothetical protein